MLAGGQAEFQDVRRSVEVSVTTISAAVDLGGGEIVGIQMSAVWNAANLTFQGSFDGTTFNNVYDASGNEYTVTAALGRYILTDSAELAGLRHVKVRSGTAALGVTQDAARTLQLIVRAL